MELIGIELHLAFTMSIEVKQVDKLPINRLLTRYGFSLDLRVDAEGVEQEYKNEVEEDTGIEEEVLQLFIGEPSEEFGVET